MRLSELITALSAILSEGPDDQVVFLEPGEDEGQAITAIEHDDGTVFLIG